MTAADAPLAYRQLKVLTFRCRSKTQVRMAHIYFQQQLLRSRIQMTLLVVVK